MADKSVVCVLLSILILVPALWASAEEEQWLGYRSSKEPWQEIGGGLGRQQLNPTTQPAVGQTPQPKFVAINPVFTKWETPMTKAGFLWIAFDQSKKGGMYDRLFIDSNGDGSLADEKPIKACEAQIYGSQFGPVPVVFNTDDGPVTYHLNIYFRNYENQIFIMATSGGWYEGNVIVGGKTYRCVLTDYDVNGTFNDSSMNFEKIDRIALGEPITTSAPTTAASQPQQAGGKPLDFRFVGKYIQMNDKLYHPEVAKDGAYVIFTPAENVPMGNVSVPKEIQSLVVGGVNGLFTINLKDGSGTLPVGKYRLSNWKIDRKDKKGVLWTLAGSDFDDKGLFEVKADGKTELALSDRFTGSVSASSNRRDYSFQQNLRGNLGEKITLQENGGQPPAPKLHIRNVDGSYDKTFTFEYG